MDNIIKFEDIKKRKSLTEEEIKSLFLGLVNLIKSSAIEDVADKIKSEYKKNCVQLNNAILEIKVKDEIIEDLKKENENLKSKMNKLTNKVEQLTKQNSNINKF